jgi:hypothetical protein
MPVLVDLINQVQKILPTRFGGTGNDQGYATERLILPYMNDEDHALPIGTVVHLLGIYSDRRVKESTNLREQAVVGVVVGRFSTAAATAPPVRRNSPGQWRHRRRLYPAVARCPALLT